MKRRAWNIRRKRRIFLHRRFRKLLESFREQLLAGHGYLSTHYRSTAKKIHWGLIDRASNNDNRSRKLAVSPNAVATQCVPSLFYTQARTQTSPSSRSLASISRFYAPLHRVRVRFECLSEILQIVKFVRRANMDIQKPLHTELTLGERALQFYSDYNIAGY